MPTVVIDTSALFDDPLLETPHMQALIERSRTKEIRLVIPEVVVLELLNKFRERAQRLIADAQSNDQNLGRLLEVDRPTIDIDLKAAVERHSERLRQRLDEAEIVVPAIPDISHQSLVERAISRRRPFSDKGKGYRDTLIWLTALDCVRADDVLFITKNSHDFGDGEDPPALHPHLLEEVEQTVGREHSVTLFGALESGSHASEAIAAEREAREAAATSTLELLVASVAAKNDTWLRLVSAIESGIKQSRLVRWYLSGSGRITFEDLAIYSIDVHEIELIGAQQIDLARVVIDLRARCEMDADVYLFKGDAYGENLEKLGITVRDWDWNDHYVYAGLDGAFEARGSVIFNRIVSTIEEFAVVEIGNP